MSNEKHEITGYYGSKTYADDLIVRYASIDIESFEEVWLREVERKLALEVMRDFAYKSELDGPYLVIGFDFDAFEDKERGVFIVSAKMGISKGSYK